MDWPGKAELGFQEVRAGWRSIPWRSMAVSFRLLVKREGSLFSLAMFNFQEFVPLHPDRCSPHLLWTPKQQNPSRTGFNGRANLRPRAPATYSFLPPVVTVTNSALPTCPRSVLATICVCLFVLLLHLPVIHCQNAPHRLRDVVGSDRRTEV